jgi:hypothetical protein
MNKLSINFTPNAKSLSSISGIKLFDDLFHKFEIKQLVSPELPKKERKRGFSSWNKFYTGIMGLIAGCECLDDFDWYGNDPLFLKLTNSPSALTIGNFLRKFRLKEIERIRRIIPELALKVRLTLEPKCHKIIFKMDSSDHKQYGKKSEGVSFGYKKELCLNSQNLFDDKGLLYGFKLRSGNTHSSVDATELLYETFSKIPNKINKYFVADSAYSTMEIYSTLINHKCNFVINLKSNVWKSILTKNKKRMKWTKSKLRFFDSESCEISSALYPLKGLPNQSFLRVVFIRAENINPTKEDNFPYRYYAVVTDMSESEMSDENILKFYRRRSQVENNIKDLKNGFDFHHFPCMSLKANNVWGLMGVIAYNLMRYASFAVVPDRGCFIKTTRRKIVTIAGEVITHARSIEIKMMNYFYQEVCRVKAIMNSVITVDANRLKTQLAFKT